MTSWSPVFRSAVAAALAAVLLLAPGGGPAHAHQVNVFAYVDRDAVVVEARFSNGRMAREGVVRVFDGADVLVHETALGEDGTARVPLAQHEAGLRIEVSTGENHSNYWILTPQDIAEQQAADRP